MITSTAPRLRDRFPTLATATYLVSHSMGAPPVGAREALAAYWEAWAHDGPEAWHAWYPALTEIADGIGRIVGAPPDTVSLVPNVSLAIAAIASSLNYTTDRREIVVESLQFPSVTYVLDAWQRHGARVVVVPSDDGRGVPTERLLAAITERTAMVVLSHAAYQSGATIDAAAIAARARETGALFVLDAYQTTGIVPIDAVALGVDCIVGGSHKWLCGGPGCGFVFVRPGVREQLMPAVTGWMGHAEPFAFEPAPIGTRAAPTASRRAHRRSRDTSRRARATMRSSTSASPRFASTTCGSPRCSPRVRSNAALTCRHRWIPRGARAGSGWTSPALARRPRSSSRAGSSWITGPAAASA